jgi:hypothetical protein
MAEWVADGRLAIAPTEYVILSTDGPGSDFEVFYRGKKMNSITGIIVSGVADLMDYGPPDEDD